MRKRYQVRLTGRRVDSDPRSYWLRGSRDHSARALSKSFLFRLANMSDNVRVQIRNEGCEWRDFGEVE